MQKRKGEPAETTRSAKASKVSMPPTEIVKSYESELERILDQGRQLLINALKLCQRFERQKLGRRSRNAKIEKNDAEFERIDEEIKALNTLNIDDTADRHIKKILQKVKSISSSEQLPDSLISKTFPQWNHATITITSRLYNAKQVKEVMDLLVTSVREEVAKPKVTSNNASTKDQPPVTKFKSGQMQREDVVPIDVGTVSDHEGTRHTVTGKSDEALFGDPRVSEYGEEMPLFSGSDTASDKDEREEVDRSRGLKYPQRYSGLKEPHHKPNQKSFIRDISLSPSPEQPLSHEFEADIPSNRALKSSTFLPSLTTAGYISGSESEASDINDEIAPRKNRRGQQARRLIAERKYGANAKHLQNASKSKQGRDQGWDTRRGAVANAGIRNGPNPRLEKRPINPQIYDPVQEPVEKSRKKDDSGPLHPSWAARKEAKAKEKISIQQFAGKKIVFD